MFLLQYYALENRTILENQNTTRRTIRRYVVKTVEPSRGKIPDEGSIKRLPFGLLKTDHSIRALIDFISQGIPFILAIQTSNIPAKNIPASIHSDRQDKRAPNST